MKSVTVLPLLLVLSGLSIPLAGAQTRIGQVTLTPTVPVSAPASTGTRQEYDWDSVPAGMTELRGRISAAREGLRLPAGSRISVTVEDVGASTTRSVASAVFSTTRLSTPYQLYFSAGRLNAGRRYVVRCRIVNAAGTTIYRSADIALPRQPRATLNIAVNAVP